MTSPNLSVNFFAPVSPVSSAFGVGTCLIKVGTSYVPCTTSSMSGLSTFDGVSLDAGQANGVVRIQSDGIVPSEVTGLGAGAVLPARLNLSTSRLERAATTSAGDILFGTVREDGSILASQGAAIVARAVSSGVGVGTTTCTLRQFGALGNSPTADQAAFNAAVDAINAGIYDQLMIDAGTFVCSSQGTKRFQRPVRVFGQDPIASAIATTDNAYVIWITGSTEGSIVEGFSISGSGGNSGLGNQDGIEDGTSFTGTNRLSIRNMVLLNLGGRAISTVAAPDITPNQITGCQIDSCYDGLFLANATMLDHCRIERCFNYAVNIDAGNCIIDECDITLNANAFYIYATANDAHSIVSNCNIRHSSIGNLVYCAAISNGMTFEGNHFYQGDIHIIGSPGTSAYSLVRFSGGIMDVSNLYFDGALVQFDGVKFVEAYYSSFTSVNDSDVEVTDTCRGLTGSTNRLPSWAAALKRIAYTFPSDADQNLTRQQSRAILDIQPGVITAPRKLHSALPPTNGQRGRAINRTAQTVKYYFSSGTGISLPTLQSAEFQGDGANAISTNPALAVSP